MRRLSRYARRGEGAQGVIEFALIITALLLVFLGTVDFSRFLYYQTAIDNAVRVGAESTINHCYSHSACGSSATATTADDALWSTYCEAKAYITLLPSYTQATTGAPSSGPCALPPGQTLSNGTIAGDVCSAGCSAGAGSNCVYDDCVRWYACANSGFSDNLADGTCVAQIGNVISGVLLTSSVCTAGGSPPSAYGGVVVTLGTATYCRSGLATPSSTGAEGAGAYVDAGYKFSPIAFVISAFFPGKTCWSAASSGSAWPADSASQNHHTICAESVGRVS
jgi:hypothetical protein